MASDEFEWDDGKNRRNLAKHGVDFEAAKRVFGGPCLEKPDVRREYGEQRLICVGIVDDVELVVVYTWRSGARRLISARRAHDRERKAYRQAFADFEGT